ncbi:F-box protein At3g17710-like [Papaver somniferum]|uniref:F-box protein At3g17710-like n=1 Tax=Papaver somniferum TaxID=3469 RepID=UPI000E704C5C|nr:F-box protein At3g17710-like [Papaver somniferum]
MEILTRLPVKPLFRFRVVKKSWYDLKNDSDFIKRHPEHSIEKNEYQTLYTSNAGEVCAIDQSLLVSSGVVRIQKFDVPYGRFHYVPGRFKPIRPLRLIRIHCSCNGLLFVDMSDGSRDGWATGLWNPATREFIILSMATTPTGCNRTSGLSFANRCGFGYDSKIDDYKVVRLAVPSNTDDTMASQVDVYILGSDSWRKIEDTPYKITDSSAGVFVNGALHWLANPYPGLVFYDPKHETARFHKIKWPECSRAPCFARRESSCYTETYLESLVSLCSGNYVGNEQEDTFESLVSLHSGIYLGSDQEDSDSDPNESDDEWETVSGSDPDESDDEWETDSDSETSFGSLQMVRKE